MKKILIVSFTPFFGGGESFIVSILSKISNNLFYIVANEHLYTILKNNNKYLLKPGSFLSRIRLVKKYIYDNHIDIVILNGGSALFAAPFLNQIPTIGIRHTLNSLIPLTKKWYYIILLHIAYYSFDVIVHVSNKSRREQLLFNKKSITIYNGVEIKSTDTDKKLSRARKNDALRFIFIGRVSKDKGVDILIDAFESLNNKNINLYIVGSGELYTTNKTYKAVTFYGFQSDLERFYLLADYFISLPSVENCPFSTLDALSYGVPVITTKAGGLNEIIKDGYNGFFIKRDIESVKRIIDKLLVADNNQYDILKENARKTIVDQFNIDDTINKYRQIIETLCE